MRKRPFFLPPAKAQLNRVDGMGGDGPIRRRPVEISSERYRDVDVYLGTGR